MQVQRVIEQLGFSSKEAKVYLASLALGESHVSDIATKVKIPRSSAQVIVDRLHREGLMNFYVMHRYKYWVAESPERLMATLRERESALQAVMPRLSALRHISGRRPIVNILKGADDLKFIHDDILATKHSVQSIISWDEWIELLGYDYMKDFREVRTKHYLHMDMLVPKTENTIKVKSKDSKELRHTRFLPKHMKIGTSNFLYGTKVAIVSLNRKEPTGIIIDDPDVANTMSVFFRELWCKSSER